MCKESKPLIGEFSAMYKVFSKTPAYPKSILLLMIVIIVIIIVIISI